MQKSTISLKKKIIARLNRIRGQVEAVAKMIKDGEDSSKIAIQLSAVESAIRSVKSAYYKYRIIEGFMDKFETVVEEIKD